MSTTGIPPDLPRHQTFTTQEATQRFQAFTAGFAHVRAGMDTLRGRGQALEQQVRSSVQHLSFARYHDR